MKKQRAKDPNYVKITFSASGLPQGFTLNKRTGVVSGRPEWSMAGGQSEPIQIKITLVEGL